MKGHDFLVKKDPFGSKILRVPVQQGKIPPLLGNAL
jgi:hypothetical protein